MSSAELIVSIFKRFFAFGCSYTSYGWPTWANLLSLNFDEYHNWALAGLGNRAIAERVAEANARYKFDKDDLVVFLAKREQLKEVESIFSVSSI